MDNQIDTPAAGEPMPWYDVWMEVVTHPSRNTFRRILADPTAGPARAYFWVGILGLIFGVLQAVMIQIFGASLYRDLPGMGLATMTVCIMILTPIVSVIGLALGSAILHGIALLLKGQGTYNQLVYCMAAIQAPVSIVSYLISLITSALAASTMNTGGSGPLASLCILPFTMAISVYIIVLEVLAVDTVEKFGTGKAIATVLIPVFVGILLGVCVAVAASAAAFNQLGQ